MRIKWPAIVAVSLVVAALVLVSFVQITELRDDFKAEQSRGAVIEENYNELSNKFRTLCLEEDIEDITTCQASITPPPTNTDPDAPLVGPPGPSGAVGPQGPAGIDGEPGRPGDDGEPGDTGAAGVDGTDGESGTDGEDGAQGEQGPAGPQGEQGPVGPQGPAGPAGPAGATGPAGPSGAELTAGMGCSGEGPERYVITVTPTVSNGVVSLTCEYATDDTGIIGGPQQ